MELKEKQRELRGDLAALRMERGASTRRRAGRKWPLVVIAALALGAAAAMVSRSRPPQVKVAYAAPEGVGDVPVLSGSGYVVTADRYVSIGVRVAGRIDRYFVEEGQHVGANDPLVQLDDRDYRAAVARIEAGLKLARANLALAQAELRRGLTLRQGGVSSVQEIDVLHNRAAVAEATVSQLEAELTQAKINLDYTTLRTPTEGVVLAKLKEVGEIAVPGGFAGSGDLVRIANLSELRAEVDINESDLSRIRLGQPAEVIPDAYPDRHYPAEVVKLYPQVDKQKGTLKVEVRVKQPDDKLLPDMSARISFLRDPSGPNAEPPGLLVPADSVQRDGNTFFVWRVKDQVAERVDVDTGGSAAGKIRIRKGLQDGDAVVVGEVKLRPGQKVTVESQT